MLTGSGEEHDVVDAIMAGACGYLLKDANSDEIVEAVRAAAAGQSVIDRSVAGRLLAQVAVRPTTPSLAMRSASS